MPTIVNVVNQALQVLGTRTTVTQNELTNETSNEAKQVNLVYNQVQIDLMRMAPWNCARAYRNLTLITSVPGTPENTSPATELWEPGQPAPPWLYEYQFPNDCARACFIVPAFMTGFSGSGVPITMAVTGGAPQFWQGPAIKFNVATDEFYPITDMGIANGGLGHAVNDIITLNRGPTDEVPIGAPAQILVDAVDGSGTITAASVISQVPDSLFTMGGSYFSNQNGTVWDQDQTTGDGTGASFTIFSPNVKYAQRVILTNQEAATLAYNKNVGDPNVWDNLFRSAFIHALASRCAMALTGDRGLVKDCTEKVNEFILEARKADGNEGLTVNDVTPDFIRIRGINYPMNNPWSSGFDWGPLWSAW